MALHDVQGQDRASAALTAALASRNVHHAWRFHGPDGLGKALAAVGLAQALTCPEKPFVGCGSCGSRTRMARRNHPDVTWLMPEDERIGETTRETAGPVERRSAAQGGVKHEDEAVGERGEVL